MGTLRFILGRAGTGKTRWCVDRISAQLQKRALGGAGIFWILPKQATFQAQRMLAGELGGYFRVECLDFSDLARRVVAETGGEGGAEVTELGRQIILGHLLRTNAKDLTFFSNVAHHPGAAAELDRTFAEIEQTGREMGELRKAVGEISAEPSLMAKVHDLELLYGKYHEFLGRERVDPTRRLARALAGIAQCRSLRGALVLVDGFFDFTAFERKVLVGLAQTAGEMRVALMVDPAADCIGNPHHIPQEMSLFHRTEETYRRLYFAFSEAGIEMEKAVVLGPTKRYLSSGLGELERWESEGKIADGVEMATAADRRGEVDAAARWILELTRKGYRYRDMAVLMRDEAEYREAIEMSFGEHGIPYFADRRRTAGHHPLVRLIRGVIGMAAQRWPTESVIAVVKTGLVGLSGEEGDFLENAALRCGITHQGWMGNWNDAQGEKLRRGIVERIGPFVQLAGRNEERSVAEWAGGLVGVMESLGVRATIVKWMEEAEKAGRLEERGEHERLWGATAELLDTLVELLGEERMRIGDFAGVVDAALEGFDLAIAPPTVDQVMVGSVDRTRTGTVRAAVVLGLAEGQFPRGHRETSLFSDADRRLLRAREFELDPDADRKLLDEEFWAYQAFTRASEKLLVTRATGDEGGKKRNASVYWDRMEKRGGRICQEEPDAIWSPRELAGGLMRWARGNAHGEAMGFGGEGGDADWPGVYSWFAGDTGNESIELLKRTAWKALRPVEKAALSDPTAAMLARERMPVTELESFAACPFQHFAKYTLGLKKREVWEVRAADVTHLYRSVLEKWGREMMEAGMTWEQDVAWREEIERWIAQTGKEWREKLLMATAQHRYVLGRAGRVLEMVAAAQRAMGRRGAFRVADVGVKYGMEIVTPGGKRVVVEGKIDRVDRAADGSVCTVDYRWEAKKPGISEMFYGLSLRMAAGLLGLKGGNKGDNAAAALMVQLSRPAEKGDGAEGPRPGEEAFDLMVKPRGIIDARVLNLLDRQIEKGGQSDVINVRINKNGELGNIENSDAFTTQELAALLDHARREMGRIADRILAGEIEVRPYRLGKVTACARCAYQDVCRFERAPGAYNDLAGISRKGLTERGKS